jgi:hypothetical protein
LRQTTEKEENDWVARCKVSTCNEQKIKCPVCKHSGHYNLHFDKTVNSGYRFRRVIQHSHYVESTDAGRNMYCKLDFFIILHSDDVDLSPRLKPTVRKRIIQRWVDER